MLNDKINSHQTLSSVKYDSTSSIKITNITLTFVLADEFNDLLPWYKSTCTQEISTTEPLKILKDASSPHNLTSTVALPSDRVTIFLFVSFVSMMPDTLNTPIRKIKMHMHQTFAFNTPNKGAVTNTIKVTNMIKCISLPLYQLEENISGNKFTN